MYSAMSNLPFSWTPRRHALAKKLWSESKTAPQIATVLGCAASTVSAHAYYHRDEFPSRQRYARLGRNMRHSRDQLIIEEYAEGKTSLRKLAAEYGMSVAGVHKIINPKSYING
jgi:hypothetical protein